MFSSRSVLRGNAARRLAGLVAALAAAASAATVLPGPAQAATPGYVALGDSFSSGTGTRTYISDGTSCQRSVYSYAPLIAASKGYSLNFRACSGATTADVANLQIGALGTGTAYVTITVGGNDAKFADVLTECALPAWASNCNAAIDAGVNIVNNLLPGRLSSLFAAIRARAPQAKVVVAGYPRIFNGEDCNALTWFSSAEETRLNASADLINSKLATAAREAGFTFSNPTQAFVGHAVCDRTEWLNGLSSPTSNSYHPNRLGHSSGYMPLISTQLTGAAVTATAPTLQRAAASGALLTAQQRRYAVQDRAITPESFELPDLTSPDMERAAARAGVDLSDRASIATMDRAYEARQDNSR